MIALFLSIVLAQSFCQNTYDACFWCFYGEHVCHTNVLYSWSTLCANSIKPAPSLPLLLRLISLPCFASPHPTSPHLTPPQEKLLGNTSPDLLTVLQLQVELLRRSRKYAEAEHVCTRALGICGAAYGPSDVQVAFWKNQLAQVKYV